MKPTTIGLLAAAAVIVAFLIGTQFQLDRETPAENMGDAMENMGDAVEGAADRMGDAVDDAADQVEGN